MLPAVPAHLTMSNEGLDEYQLGAGNRCPLRGQRWLTSDVGHDRKNDCGPKMCGGHR
jgi:hypothetical protein